MSKKRLSEILVDTNQKILWEEVKLGTFSTKCEIFLGNRGKSETRENASLPQGRWTPLARMKMCQWHEIEYLHDMNLGSNFFFFFVAHAMPSHASATHLRSLSTLSCLLQCVLPLVKSYSVQTLLRNESV